MKWFSLIMSFMLSLLGGESTAPAPERSVNIIEKSTDSETSPRANPDREFCLTTAHGYAFSGQSTSSPVSLRPSPTGRRITPQTKSSYRIVKGGKIIDNNHLHPFLALSFIQLSGTDVPDRYLYSICRLRL